MKKLRSWLLIVMIGITACEGPMGPQGPPGRDAAETQWWLLDFTVTRQMWELIGDPNDIGSFYRCVFDVPDLSTAIYNDGGIFCNYRYKDDFGDDVQTPLPFTYYDIDIRDGVEFPFAVQISYDVTPGSVAFKLVFSDFYTGDFDPPALCKFRMNLVY